MFVPSEPQLGTRPIGSIDASALLPVGSIRKFYDPVLGEGEFIYLPGVASNAAGQAVTYDLGAGTVTALPSTANLACPVAFAMAAILASQFGWYQIGGQAAVLTTGTVADGNNLFISATAGTLQSTAVAGKEIMNAKASGANGGAGTNLTYATINRPFAEGQIT